MDAIFIVLILLVIAKQLLATLSYLLYIVIGLNYYSAVVWGT